MGRWNAASDDAGEDEIDDVVCDDATSKRLHSIYSHPAEGESMGSLSPCVDKTANKFSRRESRSPEIDLKADSYSGSHDESISDEEAFALTEHSLAYGLSQFQGRDHINEFVHYEESTWDDPRDEISELTPNISSEPSSTKESTSIADFLANLENKDRHPVHSSLSRFNVNEQKANSAIYRRNSTYVERKNLDAEDPIEYIDGHTSSEDEEYDARLCGDTNKMEEHEPYVGTQKNEENTMADLFQEALNTYGTNCSPIKAVNPRKCSKRLVVRNGYFARLQQLIKTENCRHDELLKQRQKDEALSNERGFHARILSRSLEGKHVVCQCSLHGCINPGEGTIKCIDEETINRFIIFSSIICDTADLVVGRRIHIYSPWKEILVQDGQTILLTSYFSPDDTL